MFQSMEVRGKTVSGTLRRVIETLFFCTLFALPWINEVRASTLLFIILGCLLALGGLLNIDYTGYRKQILFGSFSIYFLLQVVSFFWFRDSYNRAALEQKASLVVLPLLLYVLAGNYKNVWRTGITGFILGNALAAICCLFIAIARYAYTHDAGVFFYHRYASPIGLSAIYFSFYLLIALGYIVLNKAQYIIYPKLLGVFLYINLLLLSSKLAVITGSLLLLVLLFRAVKTTGRKAALLAITGCVCILLSITANPIKKRFADINMDSYSSAMTTTNFTNYHFDGLSLRLVLWRLGYGLVNEKGLWLIGDGGPHYHTDLNEKIKAYSLYAGNSTTQDVGYQNYNMHNQYMETYVQFGVAGITLLMFVLLYVLVQAIRYRQDMLIYATVLFAVAFLTESVLETQAGILLFTIILSGEWILLQKKRSGEQM